MQVQSIVRFNIEIGVLDGLLSMCEEGQLAGELILNILHENC